MQDSLSTHIDLWARQVLDAGTPSFGVDSVSNSSVVAGQIFGQESQLIASSVDSGVISLRNIIDTPTTLQENLIVFFLLLTLGYVTIRYWSVILQLISQLFTSKNILPADENQPIEHLSFFRVSKLLFLLVPTVVLSFLFGDLYSVDMGLLLVFGMTFVVVSVVYFLKFFIAKLLSKFDYNPERWRVLALVRNKTLALLSLLFALIVMLFTLFTVNHTVLFIFSAILLIYYIFKIIFIFSALRFSLFQSILYLCAFETAPYLVMWGLITTIVEL